MNNFSQLHPKWKGIPLGVAGGQTIGSSGCLVTVGASMLFDFGFDTDPGRLNRWLCRHGGFTGGNRVIFEALEPLGAELVGLVDCARSPAPVDKLAEALEAGQAVVAKVDFYPGGGVQQHWVRVVSITEDDAMVMDPWLPASTDCCYWMMARYGHHTWEGTARAIYRAVIYAQKPEMMTFAFHLPEQPHYQQDVSVMPG